MRPETLIPLLALGTLATGLLFASTWMALRARGPARPRPARRSFEHGRRLARAKRPTSEADALTAIGASSMGRVIRAERSGRGYELAIERKRKNACAPAAGFVAGAFESAWAHEVHVEHTTCSGPKGGECVYRVSPLVSSGARPTGGASTQG